MTYLKPLPQISAEFRPFWEALKRHEFVVPRCTRCGDYNWVPLPACRTCFSPEQVWTQLSGDAEVFSYTIVRRGPGVFNEEVPYVVVLAEFAERPRPLLVLGNLVGCDIDDVHIGMPLKITYEDIPDEDVTMWRFAPRPAGSPSR